MTRVLTKGCFYWVRMVIGDERTNLMPETVWAPARYTGKSADTHMREETRGDMIVAVAYSPETWDFVGFRSDDGHHFVDVMQVGPEIIREEPESDCDFRERLKNGAKLTDEHWERAATITGADLDVLAGFYGFTRAGI